MRKVHVYAADSVAFYEEVIEKKNITKADPNYKERISCLFDRVDKRYLLYDEKFNADKLTEIPEANYTDKEKEDLLSLYKYSAGTFASLLKKLTVDKFGQQSSDCFNCMWGEINCFDHYLPKELYPDFAVNPKNLIPSCTKCNGHKSKRWQDGGKRIFLNPYIDKLPDKQFLFTSVALDGDTVKVKFEIANPEGIDDDLFALITSHFKELMICSRLPSRCRNIILNTRNSLIKWTRKHSREEVIQDIIDVANENRETMGYNFFSCILEIALVESDRFVHFCLKENN